MATYYSYLYNTSPYNQGEYVRLTEDFFENIYEFSYNIYRTEFKDLEQETKESFNKKQLQKI